MSPLLPSLAVGLLAPAALAQSTEYLIDFGDDTAPSGAQVQVWNDFTDEDLFDTVPLVDSFGNPTPVVLSLVPTLARSDLNGVQVPEPGSSLEQLGWPLSAYGDALGSDTAQAVPEMTFLLQGLDPSATYDFTIVGSLMESGLSLATEYTAIGVDSMATANEIAQNTSEVFSLAGSRARADGTLELRVRNALANDSFGRRFYVNALSMVEHAAGTQVPLMGFSQDLVETSRPQGSTGFLTSLELYTSTGATQAGALSALDAGTGEQPSWLSVPGTAVPGQPFNLAVSPGELPIGTYTAHLRVTSPGFVGLGADIVLEVRDPGRLNVLYFGNSYTKANGMVPEVVDRVAAEVGLVAPSSTVRVGPNKNLDYHLLPHEVLAISRSMPLGERWDVVVIQGGTTEATATLGNPGQFVADGLAIMANVRGHSPFVRAVIYQTWARGAGHAYYAGSNPIYPGGPLQMHKELELGNRALADALGATYEPGVAVIAPAGETAALRGFDPAYYNPDLSHPNALLTAQASGTIYSALFGRPACSAALDFATPGPTAAHLASLGLDQDDWRSVAGIADRAGPNKLRPYPGSNEDLLLEVGPEGLEVACGKQVLPAGTALHCRLTSPGSTYSLQPARLYLDVIGTSGGTTFVPPWQEVHFSPSSWTVAAVTVLGNGITVVEALPLELVGRKLLIQGMAEGPSVSTGHTLTLTDAHAVTILAPPLVTGQLFGKAGQNP